MRRAVAVGLGQLGEVQYGFNLSPTYGVNGSLMGGITGGYSVDTTKQPLLSPPAGCENTTVGVPRRPPS